jgi:hypothetical protein
LKVKNEIFILSQFVGSLFLCSGFNR